MNIYEFHGQMGTAGNVRQPNYVNFRLMFDIISTQGLCNKLSSCLRGILRDKTRHFATRNTFVLSHAISTLMLKARQKNITCLSPYVGSVYM